MTIELNSFTDYYSLKGNKLIYAYGCTTEPIERPNVIVVHVREIVTPISLFFSSAQRQPESSRSWSQLAYGNFSPLQTLRKIH